MIRKKPLPLWDMKERLWIDPEQGKVYWRDTRREAFNTLHHGGYLHGRFGKQTYMAHRVIWGLHFNVSDFSELDHINLDKTNNRISNLRLVTRRQNVLNRPVFKGSSSPYKGVSWCNVMNKWRVRAVNSTGETVLLGYHDDELEGALVYDNFAVMEHGDYARLNFPNKTQASEDS